jgi:hypothetical protein
MGSVDDGPRVQERRRRHRKQQTRILDVFAQRNNGGKLASGNWEQELEHKQKQHVHVDGCAEEPKKLIMKGRLLLVLLELRADVVADADAGTGAGVVDVAAVDVDGLGRCISILGGRRGTYRSMHKCRDCQSAIMAPSRLPC